MTSLNLSDFGTIEPPEEKAGLISDSLRDVFILINYVTLMGIFSFFGTVSNAVNITVFCRLGMKDTINISLLGLAVSDLLLCVTHQWQSVCYTLWMFKSSTSINYRHLQYLTAAWTTGMFARASTWLTVFITLERCLCVAIPLRVKRLLTPRVVVLVNIVIFTLCISIHLPIFYAVGLKNYFVNSQNETMLGLYYRPHGRLIEKPLISVIGGGQMASFILVFVLTSILAAKLKSKSRWRHRTKTSGLGATQNDDAVSAKDKRACRMVISICLVFICLLAPSWFSGLTALIVPEYSHLGRYKNLFLSMFSTSLQLETLCATINIFIYYKMNSKFATTLNLLFHRTTNEPRK